MCECVSVCEGGRGEREGGREGVLMQAQVHTQAHEHADLNFWGNGNSVHCIIKVGMCHMPAAFS